MTRATAPARQAASGARASARRANEVRLVGGSLRRSRLPVLDRPGLRPTPDRVRETLFNWLGQDLTGWRCLDAFAGSGALGFEAASRGAAAVTLIERDPALAESLRQSALRLQATAVTVVAADALAWMKRGTPASLELVLLDPPFDSSLQAPALALAAPLVVDGGWLYLESAAAMRDDGVPDGLCLWRQAKAGAVHYHLLRRSNPTHGG